MNKFIPASDYESLRRQAFALSSLVKGLETELEYYREKSFACSERRLAALQAQVQSEREMNAILTEELDKVRPLK